MMRWRPRLLAADPPELLVYDEATACPYLAGRDARMPLRVPTRMLTLQEFAERLRAGDRRQGVLLYRTACPSCQACEPIRIDVEQFAPDRSQRRVHRRGLRTLDVEIGPPEFSHEKVALYNRHKAGRGLSADGQDIDEAGYRAFLVDTCCESFELRYRLDGRLVGVAVVDRAEDALSAVYFYFDPEFERLSPGVFSIMKQIELCRAWGLRFLYLGLYIRDCPSMAYKARYLPHERRLEGRWRRFDGGGAVPEDRI
jgi:arginyl-tRNA--protein-N-Asp/Glu arginylyltransferase